MPYITVDLTLNGESGIDNPMSLCYNLKID